MKKNLWATFYMACTFLFMNTSTFAQDEMLDISTAEKEIFGTEEEDMASPKDSIEYDITIIDIGYNRWLNQIARPKGYYTQSFMENRNYIFVLEWNRRFLAPQRYDPMLYEVQINYDPNIDYGYDVNYKLYNYFIYFQRRYNQRLGPFLPRI